MRTKPYQCIYCRSILAQPITWNRLNEESYNIVFRCPECGDNFYRAFDRREVDELGNNFGDAYVALAEKMEELDRERFSSQAEDFISALRQGHIWPEDFGHI